MNNREKIVAFMQWKGLLIWRKTKIRYMDKRDVEKILSSEQKDVDKFIDDLRALGVFDITDSSICFACGIYWGNCYRCWYAKHHGECDENGLEGNDTYRRIVQAGKGSITEIIGRYVIHAKIEEIFD